MGIPTVFGFVLRDSWVLGLGSFSPLPSHPKNRSYISTATTAHPLHLFDCWHCSDFKCYKNKGLVVAWEDAEGCGWSVSLLSLKEESATKYTKEQGPAQRDWALLCQGSGHTPQDNHKDLTRNRKLFLNETSTEAVGTSTFGYSSDTKDFRTTYKYILQDFEYVAFWPFHGMLQGLTCYVDTVTALGGWNDVGSG